MVKGLRSFIEVKLPVPQWNNTAFRGWCNSIDVFKVKCNKIPETQVAMDVFTLLCYCCIRTNVLYCKYLVFPHTAGVKPFKE